MTDRATKRKPSAEQMSDEPGGIPLWIYRTLVTSVRDYAIFVLDTSGHIRTWNEGAQLFKGYTANEIIGKHFSVFYPQHDLDAGKPALELKLALRDGRFEDEGWRVRKDGSRFWANVIITALFDEAGEHIGFGKVTRDLTERREAQERALEDARRVAIAETANRAKGDFLAAMSHELRTPLNAIGGYVDLITMEIAGPITAQQQAYLDRVRHSQKHLLAVISDLLNFSRMEAGQLSYDLRPFEIATAVDAVAPIVEPQVASRGLIFKRPTIAHDVRVVADLRKTEQILVNLLSNAMKFTERGGSVGIECSMNDTQVTIDVVDTGRGIAHEKLEAIFEPFVQLGRSLTSAHEGTGLGLAISRDLARAMGGDLTVRSEPGEGSTFSLKLPRDHG